MKQSRDMSFDFIAEPEKVLIPIFYSDLVEGEPLAVWIFDAGHPLVMRERYKDEYVRYECVLINGLKGGINLRRYLVSLPYTAFKFAWCRKGLVIPKHEMMDMFAVIQRTTKRRFEFMEAEIFRKDNTDVEKKILEYHQRYEKVTEYGRIPEQ